MRVISKGITKLSALTIDAAKDWQGKDITNLGVISPAQITDGVLIGPKVRIDSVLQLRDLADGDYQSLVAKIIVPTGDITPLNDKVQSLGSATNNFLDVFARGSLNTFPLANQTTYTVLAALNDEQLTGANLSTLQGGGFIRTGQRKSLVNRTPALLGFKLHSTNQDANAIYYRIRKVSDDSIIWEKYICRCDELPGVQTWYDVIIPFAERILINEEVRFCVEYSTADALKKVTVGCNNGDVKAGEALEEYTAAWAAGAARDLIYHLELEGRVALCYASTP